MMSFVTKAMTTAMLWLAILWMRNTRPPPGNFDIEALDNGGRLTWEAPDMVADNAAVVGYMIDRMVYLQDSNNPIWQNSGDAMFMVENVTAYRELGAVLRHHLHLHGAGYSGILRRHQGIR